MPWKVIMVTPPASELAEMLKWERKDHWSAYEDASNIYVSKGFWAILFVGEVVAYPESSASPNES